jgi:hypothetical protein
MTTDEAFNIVLEAVEKRLFRSDEVVRAIGLLWL